MLQSKYPEPVCPANSAGELASLGSLGLLGSLGSLGVTNRAFATEEKSEIEAVEEVLEEEAKKEEVRVLRNQHRNEYYFKHHLPTH